MSVDYDYRPTESEELAEKLEKQTELFSNLLDRMESNIISNTEEMHDKMTNQLNTPFTKGEGLILFVGGIGGNVLIAGVLDATSSYNVVTYTGIVIVGLSMIGWSYLFSKNL